MLALSLAAGRALAIEPESPDGELAWSFGGRLQIDRSGFDGVYADDGRSHGQTYVRRAEASGRLRLGEPWRVSGTLQAGSDLKVVIDSLFITFRPSRRVSILGGRVDPDFGLDNAVSSSWTHGIERSAVWDLVPGVSDIGDGHGLRANLRGTGWLVSAGWYDKRTHRQWVARGVWSPEPTGPGWWQVGLSMAVSQGWRDDGGLRTRLGVRGVTEHPHGRRSRLLPSLRPPARYDSDDAVGVEALWQRGPWLLQAEALERRLGGSSGAADRRLHGGYVLGAWSLTGDARRRQPETGGYGAPEASRPDALSVEAFCRIDHLGVEGGKSARVRTLGISATWVPAWRLMLNLHQAESDDDNAAGDRRGTGWAVRLQAVF